jgi:polysaccharide pyruvyl transferase WcaK-like protein
LKILLEGAFGEANFGDDLLLLATLKGIREAMPMITTLVLARDDSFKGDYLDRMPEVDKVIRGWQLAFCNYRLKLFAGGTQFYSYPSNAGERQKRSLSITKRVRDKVLRSRHRFKSKAFLGIGIGPFYQGNELACERLLKSGAFLAVRDEASLEYLRKWGIPEQEVGADICFNKEWWLPAAHVSQEPVRAAPVGIVIRDFEYDLPGKGYLPPLLEFAERLRSNGQAVRCFAFSKIKDQLSIERIRSHGFEVAVWQGEISDLPAYLNSISQCSLLISARYHGVVVGSVLGVPSIGIEVDPKVKLACEELGSGAEVWSTPFNVKDLQEKYEALNANQRGARDALLFQTQRLGVRAKAMFNSFVNFTKRGV